jgi:hypothetical protein
LAPIEQRLSELERNVASRAQAEVVAVIDDQRGSMRQAQFAVAKELAARGWPEVNYTEVAGYSSRGDEWLAIVDFTEFGGEIQIRFSTPLCVNVDDDDAMRRLNRLFWDGCKTRVRVLEC